MAQWYRQQSTARQVLIGIAAGLAGIMGIAVLIFHSFLISLLVDLSDSWKQLTFGKFILFSLVFIVGFPPIIGFSALSMLCGMVYGFPNGWPLLASASVSGSFFSFIVFRYILHDKAVSLINHNEKFRAFAEILRDDNSLFLLILIRLCPLPYSLSNGALAAIPELSATTYLLASVITSPKLLIHLFVGNKIKDLGDDTKTRSNKIVDVLSIIITLLAASLTTYIIYSKMQQKLAIYHSQQTGEGQDYEAMIFGNFEDDLESGNIELNSQDFDSDNFILNDSIIEEGNNSKNNDINLDDFEIASDDDLNPSSNSRDY